MTEYVLVVYFFVGAYNQGGPTVAIEKFDNLPQCEIVEEWFKNLNVSGKIITSCLEVKK